MLAKVKSIPGRVFDPSNKSWNVPLSEPNIRLLHSFGFDLDPALDKILNGDKPKIERLPELKKVFDETPLKVLPYKLRPYQLEAAQFFEHNNWNGLLSLGCRMGKTLVALVGTLLHPEMLPCVIITTASGKGVWKEEIKLWLKKDAVVLQGNTPYQLPPDTEFVVVNYSIAPSWVEELVSLNPKYLIVDESHNVSNTKLKVDKDKEEYEEEKAINDREGKSTKKQKSIPVKCTNAFLQLAQGCKHVVELSGTPMTICPRQLRVPLSIYVKSFQNEYWFLKHFCGPTHNGYAEVYEGLSNEHELFPILDKWVFRRVKQQIWNDLPAEDHQMIPVPVDKVLYEKEMGYLRKELKSAFMSDEEVEERLGKFQSLSFSAKQSAIFTFIQEYLELGNKLVVFAWHRSAMEALKAKFKKNSIMIYGGTDAKDRAEHIKLFNEDPKTTLAILQIKSCAEAITLKADTIAYAELPPTPGLLQQSAERIWQAETGQEKLFYYYFIAEGTVDNKRVESLRKRAKLLSSVLDKNGEDAVLFGEKLADVIKEA